MREPKGLDSDRRHEGRDRRRDTRLVVMGVAAALLVWFAVVNLETVPVHFWVHTTKAPVIVVVAIAVALGAAISMLFSRFTRRRQKTDQRTEA